MKRRLLPLCFYFQYTDLDSHPAELNSCCRRQNISRRSGFLGVTTCLHPPLNILFNWSRPILSDKISADSSNRLPGWHRCKAEGKAPHYCIRNTFPCQLYQNNFCYLSMCVIQCMVSVYRQQIVPHFKQYILEKAFFCLLILYFSPSQIEGHKIKDILMIFGAKKRMMQTCKFFQYSSKGNFSIEDFCRYINSFSNSRTTSCKNTHLF